MLFGNAGDSFVDLHLGGALHLWVLENFTQRPAVSAAYDENAARVWVGEHRWVHQHLMINEVVTVRELHQAVDEQRRSKVLRLVDGDGLVGGLLLMELVFDSQGERRTGFGTGFRNPPFIQHHDARSCMEKYETIKENDSVV